MQTAVIGLGKLGAPLAATLAYRAYKVLGIDNDPAILELLGNFQAPVDETGLQGLLNSLPDSGILTVSAQVGEATLASDLVFVVVPTPSEKDGRFSTKLVKDVARQIGQALSNLHETTEERYRLFVLVSTVTPGQTQRDFIRTIENWSGIPCGEKYGVCYSPEFIALGSVIQNILEPDFVLIGESDEKAGQTLADFYTWFCRNDPPIRRMNLVNAELAKLCVNCYITTKISYANMVAELCETIPETCVDTVTQAMSLDSRIGAKYLTGGAAYGGPCFPRDNKALQAFARGQHVVSLLPVASHLTNERWQGHLTHLVCKQLESHKQTVCILGTAYKLNTMITEEAAGQKLLEELRKLSIHTQHANSLGLAQGVIKGSEIVVLTLPFPWANELDYRNKIVIDCWRVLNNPDCKKYIPLGIGATS